MRTFGNKNTRKLLSLVETSPRGFEENPGYHVEQLCPQGKYWQSHPDAPWNAPAIERDPSWWKTKYPEAWSNVSDDDPAAPWNAPEPDRDPLNYLDDEGEPLFWETPTLVPLVKLPKPDIAEDEIADPRLVWLDDRVDRVWDIRKATEEEIAASLPAHFKSSAGIRLATSEQDQTAFTRMLTLIDLTQMDPAAMVIIKDAAGEKQAMTVSNFKTMMAEYGAHCYSLHVGA